MRLEEFLLPLYQDIDGVSRFGDVQRVAAIARRLHEPNDRASFERLLLFHGLGNWLERVGNLSRTVLAVPGVTAADLWRTAMSVRHLENPETDEERAVAAAILIDRAGVRGLAQRFAAARREGQSALDVVRDELANAWTPEWVPENARTWLERRIERKRTVCAEILAEIALEDYVRSTLARS